MRTFIPYGFLSDASLSGYLNYTPSGRVAFAMAGVDTVALFYIHADVLGSFDVITDATGAVVERNSFDPWGRRRNPADWSYVNVPTTPLLTGRGFTGHEHLEGFGLINANGRIYDPVLGMFLSPDPYIQAPETVQNFNRYSYCLNNPLKYTDPDGEFFFSLLCKSIPVLQTLLPIAFAADIGGTFNAITHADNIKSFRQFAGYYGIGAASSAISLGVGLGVSSALAGESFFEGIMGTSTIVSTGFASGFVSGAAGGFFGGFVYGFGNAAMNPDNKFGDMIRDGFDFSWKGGLFGGVAGGITGGIDAIRHDRNFWTGSGKQPVVVKHSGELIGEQDYNAKYTTQKTRDFYRTPLSDNSSVTTDSNGQIIIKIPKSVNRINGLAAPDNTFFTNLNIGKKVITLTPLDNYSYVILHGWRYYSNPVTSIKNLFYWRPKLF